jgi:hypothetical protein
MAVPATGTNARTNATLGSPPASAIAAAAATTANADNINNDEDNNGVNLDARHRHFCNLRCILNASADRLADAEANTAVAHVECTQML